MSASALPSKLFFRIGEVASLVGVEPHVLRYWEREFRSIRPTKSAKGQRVYSRKDVENLLRVRDLLYRDGFTIAGAKKRLQRGGTVEAGRAEDLEESEGERETEPEALAAPSSFAPAALAHDGELAPASDIERAPDTDTDLHAEPDEDDVASSEPQSGPRSALSLDAPDSAHSLGRDPAVRAKLSALRAEVQGFLDELESER